MFHAIALTLGLAGAVPGQTVLAQNSDEIRALRAEIQSLKDAQLKNDVQTLREGQAVIQKLAEIKTLLQQQRVLGAGATAQPQDIVLRSDSGLVKGDREREAYAHRISRTTSAQSARVFSATRCRRSKGNTSARGRSIRPARLFT
jgi:hypothetical protein